MLSNDPPFATAAAYTPAKADPAVVGLPFSATMPWYSGLRRSANDMGQVFTRLASQPIAT